MRHFAKRMYDKRRACGLLAGACALALAASAPAGGLEYMQLNYEPGMTLELKGEWDTAGVFIASDIETLPKARSPKLRGPIQMINPESKTITMYGRIIRITEHTRFVEVDSLADMFSKLRIGQQIEVSCKVNEKNRWKARKIKTEDVKSSEKIKGSLTRVAVDGLPPDTLEINGLLILLNKKTDVNSPRGEVDKIEQESFKYPSFESPADAYSGVALGEKILLTGKYRGTFRSEVEYDLSPTFDRDVSDTEPGLRSELTGYWSKVFRTHAQVRARKRYLISNDRFPAPSEDIELDVTQLYALLKNIGASGISIQVGRQDFDEPREWLFDEYLDAVRVHYIGEKVVAQAALISAVNPIKPKYDSWTDVFAQVGIRLPRDSRVSAYVFKRKDSDIRNREPLWFGARYYGYPTKLVRSWAEATLMRGEDKGNTQRAWALDFGATLSGPERSFYPAITAGFAVGSGDKNDGNGFKEKFRQTGYEDNVGPLSGASTVHYYGEVLDPELSNISIITLSAALLTESGGSIEAVFHSYRQHQLDPLDPELTDSDLLDPPARPNGGSNDLGWELDVVASAPKLWERVRLRWTFGIFNPGVAFLPRQESAILNRFNIDVSL